MVGVDASVGLDAAVGVDGITREGFKGKRERAGMRPAAVSGTLVPMGEVYFSLGETTTKIHPPTHSLPADTSSF